MKQGRRSRGQALAEFALVVPIFLIVLFGIIDLGRYVYTWNALNQAARESARAGSVGVRPQECNGLARDACVDAVARARITGFGLRSGWSSSSSATAGTFVQCLRTPNGGTTPSPIAMSGCSSDDLLDVKLSADFVLVTPLIGQFLGTQPLTGEATVTVNQ